MEQIFGFIERITFFNSENGFTVARLKQPRKSELITIVGILPDIQPGETVRLLGEWKTSTHGLQFEVKECYAEIPDDLAGIKKYLSSGIIKGIGPVFAEKIVNVFGKKTLKILDEEPDKLLDIPGIGEKKVEAIKSRWQEQKSIRHLMLFLQKYGVSPSFSRKIYKIYGDEAISRIQENPYTLAREIRGVGFKSADNMAEKLGFPKDSTQRKDAGIEYLLLELSEEGHSCYPLSLFLEKAKEVLNADASSRTEVLIKENRIAIEKDYIWLKGLWICEEGIVNEISRLKKESSNLRKVDTPKAVEWAEKKLNLSLAEKQKEAVSRSLEEKLHIITGGPGTGKSTITKAILAITEKLTSRIILAAPTGRAAKRMSEITRHTASTIHSLLQYDFNEKGFRRNRQNPLECDLIIVDEASMIDTSLMYHLLRAIPNKARVLFVGDVNQLPSVGPGNVLRDLIESNYLLVTKLTEIYRQAAGSKIITNAHRINEGVFPDLTPEKNGDFFFLKAVEPEILLEKVVNLVSERLPKSYRFDPIEHIQVLSPMRRGLVGIDNLNVELQKKLNPQENVVLHRGVRYGIGDKVMQIRNNYNKEVFNGDIGRVKRIDKEEQELIVSFDGREIEYSFLDLEELVLAYATSIHKYQGSECPCVVIPLHTSHFMMLHRNLLYTAVTRGKRLVMLVGSGKAIGIAVSNNQSKKRYSGLLSKLKCKL